MYHPAKREMLNAKGKGGDCSSWWGRQGLWEWIGGPLDLVRLREDLCESSWSQALKGPVTSRVGKLWRGWSQQTLARNPNPGTAWFCMICKLRMVFPFYVVAKIKTVFNNTQKLYEIQISVFLQKVLLEHGHTGSFRGCLHLLSTTSSGCNRDHVVCEAENIYYHLPFPESLPSPARESWEENGEMKPCQAC